MNKVKHHIIHIPMGFVLGYLLYRNFIVSAIFSAAFLMYSILNKRGMEKEDTRRMNAGFREFLICLEPILKTSGSFSVSFEKACEDYEGIYGLDDLCRILKRAVLELKMNRHTGLVLRKVATGIKSEDARLFASFVSYTEESGGNVVYITDRIIGIMTEKMRMSGEIKHLLAAKKFEHTLISIIPVGILALLSAGTESYMDPLYKTAGGRIVMTVAGLLFAVSWYAGNRITSIEV